MDGDLPSSRAISRQDLPLSSILSMEFLSALVSLEYDLPAPFLPLFAMLSPIPCGPADPAFGYSGSQTHHNAFGWVGELFG